MTSYPGIDYGLGTTNRNPATGIRYGVIHARELPYWDEAEPNYGDATCPTGACYLMNTLDTPDENNRAYCPPPDWFDDDAIPFPIYSVETGELITPATLQES
jgi:hypothetical protein